MLSLYKILTIARYETKTLLRSWFFRIFSILALVILSLLNIGIHTNVGRTPWFMNGLNASLPYMNILLLNVVQAVIGVFLASDFLKRDKKLDTTEVVYMRSMTNGDYVMGKTLGILVVFIVLNIIVLLVSAVFHIFFSKASFMILPYLLYPLFISIPTLVFIFGLSFLFMVVIRNQAVTFIILLGYIATTLFFLSTKAHFVFDYMAFNVPLMYSDLVGFANMSALLIHRGIYFLLGMGFIFATILLIKRLPQSKALTRFSAVFSVICFIAAILLINAYLSKFSQGRQLRQEMIALNKEYSKLERITPLSCDLNLNHSGSKIEVQAKIIFKNDNQIPLKKYFFSLNPGLKIEKIQSQQKDLKYTRQKHIVEVAPVHALAPNSTDSLVIYYKGTINEQACYVDIKDEEREKLYRIWLYNVAKRFAFIKPDFVLLTPETMWYPLAGLPYGAVYPELVSKDFVKFSLAVKTNRDLTSISQGKVDTLNNGAIKFTPEFPLPQISLVIGDYAKKSITVDSVEYSIYYKKNHDYFSSYFTDLGDTLAALIREEKQDYEGKLGLSYIFPRFSLVEVPIQFYHYPRLWTTSVETKQPEMVFVQEKGVLMNSADFQNQSRWQKRRYERRNNQTITPQESQSEIFVQFIRSDIFNTTFRRRFFSDELMNIEPDYHVFPNYYTFVNHFKSKDIPIFNMALESFLNQRTEPVAGGFRRFFVGLSDEEKANLTLMEHNLADILANPDQFDNVNNILKLKGNYLFQIIESQIDSDEFNDFISNILQSHRFKDVDVDFFVNQLREKTNFDLTPYFKEWYQSQELPGFLVANVKAYKILDQDRTRSQVRFKIQNSEKVDGLVSVTFRMAGRRGRFFGRTGSSVDEPEEQFFRICPGQVKEIGIVLDDEPRVLNINTLVSKNIPVTISHRFDELEMNKKAVAFEGERTIDESIRLVEPGELIVDNEDPGFKIEYQAEKSFLKKLFEGKSKDKEEKYIGFNFWRPPTQWRATTASDFYGKHIHSAHYIKAGNGDKKVSWSVEIKEAGTYDVYYYASDVRSPWMRGRRGRKYIEQFQFIVYHDDGQDEVFLNIEDTEDGWNFLGTYYLSSGTAKVELTNKSKGRVVFADAVKWVKH